MSNESIVYAKQRREKRELAEQFRQEMTLTEEKLWLFLKSNKLSNLHFRRQQVIAGFIVDFYCHAASLAIEIDGAVHDQRTKYDLERTAILEQHGLSIIRFSNTQIEENLSQVLQKIKRTAHERIAMLAAKKLL